MEKIKIEEVSNLIKDDKFLIDIIERKYVPIMEKEQKINRLISLITMNYNEELDKLIEVFEVNNPVINEVLIKVEVISAYTRFDIDVTNMEEVIKVYDTLSEYQLIDKLIESLDDAQKFENLFYQKLNAHRAFKEKEYFTQNINLVSCLDNLIPYVANLMDIAAKKLEGIDVEKISKELNEVNIGELMVNYFKKANELK